MRDFHFCALSSNNPLFNLFGPSSSQGGMSEEELADLEAMGFVAIDETETKDAKNDKDAKDGDEEEEEEAVLVIEGNENADDTALTVKHIGTYYLRYDSETGEKYYVRKYVTFKITCIYTPAEEIVITDNVSTVSNGEDGN